MRKTTATLLLAGALASLPTAAFAGKPTGGGGTKPSGGTSSIALVNVDPADATVNHGDTIRFTVSTTATDRPFVSVSCSQGGTPVYSGSAGYFADYPWSKEFVLSSNNWPSGAADCTARLYSTNRDGTRTTTLATLAFRAEA